MLDSKVQIKPSVATPFVLSPLMDRSLSDIWNFKSRIMKYYSIYYFGAYIFKGLWNDINLSNISCMDRKNEIWCSRIYDELKTKRNILYDMCWALK